MKIVLVAPFIPIELGSPEPRIIGILKPILGILNVTNCKNAIVFQEDPRNLAQTKFSFTIGKWSINLSDARQEIDQNPSITLPDIEKRAIIEVIFRADLNPSLDDGSSLHSFLSNLISESNKKDAVVFVLTPRQTMDEVIKSNNNFFLVTKTDGDGGMVLIYYPLTDGSFQPEIGKRVYREFFISPTST